MTSNKLHNKITTRILLALIIIGLLCFSLFVFTACNNSSSSKDPSYSYTDVDDGLISNPTFFVGTANTELTGYPIISPTGWTRTKDSTGVSSSTRSGVVDVSEEGWAKLMENLYSDAYFLDYMMNKLNFNKEQVKEAIKNQEEHKNDANYTPTNDEIKAYIVEKYLNSTNVPNPGIRTGAQDNKVYMLNNYNSNIGFGASQKITSSSTITIKKGEFVEISVWMKTANLKGLNNEFGASIRLTSSLNNKSQAEFAITNIDTEGEWKQYLVYVKADDEFDTTVTLALGLGYNLEYQTEGTVYFDDVTVKELAKIDSLTFTADSTKTLNYFNSDAYIINTNDVEESSFLFDMSFNLADYYTTDNSDDQFTAISSESSLNGNFTTSNDKAFVWNDETRWVRSAKLSTENNQTKLELTDASYTLTLTNQGKSFTVQPSTYTSVSFYLKNNLKKSGSTTITVDVFEDTADYELTKQPALTTIDVTDDWTRYNVLIKNNFDEELFDGETRTFYINLVVGPTNITTTDSKMAYASGEVLIKDITVASGKIYNNNKLENSNFELYTFYQNDATIQTSLYSGYDSDYTSPEEDGSSNGFTVSATDLGAILSRPAVSSDYKGVVADHKYIKEDGKDITVDTRATKEGVKGSYAGIVNTKYAAQYTECGCGFSLDSIIDEENIQPLMIYNNDDADSDGDHYGFIGINSINVASNSFAKVSTQVKLVGDNAKAYIYLIDVSGQEKKVMNFVDFTGVNSIDGTKNYNGEDLKFVIELDIKDMANAIDGWINVQFYIATGDNAKTFRVELWNGGRDGSTETASKGYVFYKDIDIVETAAFSEPASVKGAFTTEGNPFYNIDEDSFENGYITYKQELTEIEKKFNAQYPDTPRTYSSKIVWAKTANTIYAVFNNIEKTATNPYDEMEDDSTTTSSGCTAETDPSTFWLSFSSILLAAVLLIAIVALFIKNYRARHKATKSDAKSHYTVTSRVRTQKKETKVEKAEQPIEETEEAVEAEEIVEEQPIEETEVVEETLEESTNDFVYGEVQNFGEEEKKED